MDKKKIVAICRAEKSAALSAVSASDLTEQRSNALDYYLGDMDEHMPAMDGGSRAVSSDVSDTIESILPSLLDVFMSSDDICEFVPEGIEDEEAARQETDVVNHVFMQENHGFMVLYEGIKDALLSKTGVFKIWWEDKEDNEKETYEGLDEMSYVALLSDPDIEIVAQTINEDQASYDVTVKKNRKYGCARVSAIPPEEFGICAGAVTIEDAGYCFHEYTRTRSQLIEEGYSRKLVESLPTGGEIEGEEEESRDVVNDDFHEATTSLQKIKITEHYVRLDEDGDGIAELLQVITAGDSSKLLSIEQIDRMPFETICPVPMPHRFFGRSVADLVMDIQRIKTHLLRAMLDNASLLNNQRMAVGEMGAGDYTIDDLLTNRPGGIIRMRDVTQLMPVQNQPIGQYILSLMEYADQSRETRTGVKRHGAGLDPDTLNPASKTATAFQGMMDLADMRIKMIARIFAETGIKNMFVHLHELLRKHQEEKLAVKLRNKWTEVNPRGWKTRTDMAVTVALGTGSKDRQLSFLNNILERQIQAIQFQGGVGGPLVTLKNIHRTLSRMVEMTGLKSPDMYFQEPDENFQPEQQPDPEMLKLQAEQQQKQAELQIKAQSQQADAQLKQEKAALDLQLMRDRATEEARLAQQKADREYELAMERMNREFALREREIELNAQMGVHKTAVDAEVKLSSNRPGGNLDE